MTDTMERARFARATFGIVLDEADGLCDETKEAVAECMTWLAQFIAAAHGGGKGEGCRCGGTGHVLTEDWNEADCSCTRRGQREFPVALYEGDAVVLRVVLEHALELYPEDEKQDAQYALDLVEKLLAAAPRVETMHGVPLGRATFRYLNHRSVTSLKRVFVLRFRWGTSAYYTEPQWLMDGWDVEKQAHRTYALARVLKWYAPPIPVEEADGRADLNDIVVGLRKIVDSIPNCLPDGTGIIGPAQWVKWAMKQLGYTLQEDSHE